MPGSKTVRSSGPRGGLHATERTLRGWRWTDHGKLVSQPVRCKGDAWYLAKARLGEGVMLERGALLVAFFRKEEPLDRRCLRLIGLAHVDRPGELVAWLHTPDDATHLQLCIPDRESAGMFEEIAFHHVSERDPKCHPLANVPRWNTYRTPFSIDRVVLPSSLESLAEHLDGLKVEIAERPTSTDELARQVRGAAVILDPGWARTLRLSLNDLKHVAASSWLLVDLHTVVRIIQQHGVADARLVNHADPLGIMSARVEYADVPTRGFALQDVFPYMWIDEHGEFATRGIKSTRGWRKLSDEEDCATLLSSETPWPQKHADIISAMCPTGGGELVMTDLPWLVAGKFGPLVVPHLAEHLLRTHLGMPIKQHLQYWNRWDSGNTIVRDISDLARRYSPLRAERWASRDPGIAHLGITLPARSPGATRHLMIQTGRMDSIDLHDGTPPEPMMIFMKWLAREAREQTAWAQKYLADCTVTWQFDTADGLKYATHFDAAESTNGQMPECLAMRMPEITRIKGAPPDEGIHGDTSMALLDAIARRIRLAIERPRRG